MRIACFAASFTTTSAVDDLGDADLAAVERGDHRSHELVRLGAPACTSRHVVAGFPELRHLLERRVVHGCPFVERMLAARAPRRRAGRARAGGARSAARARGARGRRRPRRRDRRATRAGPRRASRAAISQPSSAPRFGAQPEVEAARTAVVHEPVRGEPVAHELAAFFVPRPLLGDVLVVAERGGGRRLHRCRHHETRVLAGLDEIRHELRVAGIEAARACRPGSNASTGCAPRARPSAPALRIVAGSGANST